MNFQTGETLAENPLDEIFRMQFMEAKMLGQQLDNLPKFLINDEQNLG